ncbi:MAG: hypothetical protein AAGD43_02545 [Pseudomonadota bacterium]
MLDWSLDIEAHEWRWFSLGYYWDSEFPALHLGWWTFNFYRNERKHDE